MNKLIAILLLTSGCASTGQYARQVAELERIQQEQDKQIATLEAREKLLFEQWWFFQMRGNCR